MNEWKTGICDWACEWECSPGDVNGTRTDVGFFGALKKMGPEERSAKRKKNCYGRKYLIAFLENLRLHRAGVCISLTPLIFVSKTPWTSRLPAGITNPGRSSSVPSVGSLDPSTARCQCQVWSTSSCSPQTLLSGPSSPMWCSSLLAAPPHAYSLRAGISWLSRCPVGLSFVVDTEVSSLFILHLSSQVYMSLAWFQWWANRTFTCQHFLNPLDRFSTWMKVPETYILIWKRTKPDECYATAFLPVCLRASLLQSDPAGQEVSLFMSVFCSKPAGTTVNRQQDDT